MTSSMLDVPIFSDVGCAYLLTPSSLIVASLRPCSPSWKSAVNNVGVLSAKGAAKGATAKGATHNAPEMPSSVPGVWMSPSRPSRAPFAPRWSLDVPFAPMRGSLDVPFAPSLDVPFAPESGCPLRGLAPRWSLDVPFARASRPLRAESGCPLRALAFPAPVPCPIRSKVRERRGWRCKRWRCKRWRRVGQHMDSFRMLLPVALIWLQETTRELPGRRAIDLDTACLDSTVVHARQRLQGGVLCRTGHHCGASWGCGR